MIWSFACLALGAIAGFLFGIPRSRSRGQGRTLTRSNGNGGRTGPNPPAEQPVQPRVDAAATVKENLPATPAQVEARTIQNGGANVRQGGADGNGDSPADGDESPIEQISDWLTKIIVGLGLANLKELPALLDRWAVYVSSGISVPAGAQATGPSFALGLIIYFLILGFLSCYVLTQMFLLTFINRVRGTT